MGQQQLAARTAVRRSIPIRKSAARAIPLDRTVLEGWRKYDRLVLVVDAKLLVRDRDHSSVADLHAGNVLACDFVGLIQTGLGVAAREVVLTDPELRYGRPRCRSHIDTF